MRIISLMLLPSLRMPDNPRMLLNIASAGCRAISAEV